MFSCYITHFNVKHICKLDLHFKDNVSFIDCKHILPINKQHHLDNAICVFLMYNQKRIFL